MNEPKCILGTCSLSWKEVGRRVSAEKSHCPVEPKSGALYNPGRHIVGLQGLWIGVGTQAYSELHLFPSSGSSNGI